MTYLVNVLSYFFCLHCFISYGCIILHTLAYLLFGLIS